MHLVEVEYWIQLPTTDSHKLHYIFTHLSPVRSSTLRDHIAFMGSKFDAVIPAHCIIGGAGITICTRIMYDYSTPLCRNSKFRIHYGHGSFTSQY